MALFLAMSLASSISYADGFQAGLHIQNTDIDEITMNQQNATDSIQGQNIVKGSNKGVWQTTEADTIDMKQEGGHDSIQCVNCVKTDSGVSGSYQDVDANEVTMTQTGGDSNIQGVNVVDSN